MGTVALRGPVQSLMGKQKMDDPTVSLDMESVLAGTNHYLIMEHARRHGSDYDIDDIDTWDWVDTEIGYDEFMEIVDKGWGEHDKIPALESNLSEVVHHLSETGAVDIVTARNGVEEQMRSWLASHDITAYDDFISGDYDMNKAELGYDFLIDDKPALAGDLDSDQHLFMIEHPYNGHIEQHNVTHVETVAQAAYLIRYKH